MTGSGLSQTKKGRDGSANVGIYMNYSNMSLMWNLM